MRILLSCASAGWLGLVLLFCGQPAFALSYVMMTDEDLFDQAAGVIRAKVLRELPANDGDSQTRYVLHVDSILAGNFLPSKQVLSLPGTFTAPTTNAVIPGIPRIVEGSTIVLFYGRAANGELRALHLSLGLFGLEASADGGQYVRSMERNADTEVEIINQRFHRRRDAQAFERWLADRGRGEVRDVDYLLDETKQTSASKFTFTVFQFPQPGPGRWFQFDSNQTMPWTAHPGGQDNTSLNEFTAVQNALAGWTNDPGSRILLSYSGTLNFSGNQAANSFCGTGGAPACFSGHVLWNDPNGVVNGSYDCGTGGTLAIGGSYVTSNGQTFGGQTWYPRLEGFVIVNNGAGCFLDGSGGADGAELLTHEIGHSLAFGHACGDGLSPTCGSNATLNAAIMRAFVHGGGRGATLGIDDQAGAAIAYPNPAGSNIGPQFAALSPANNSSTPMGGGTIGTQLTREITYTVSGGSGSGTTQLTCSVGSGTVSVVSGSPQTVGVGGSANAVVVRFTLGAGAQSGVVNCAAVRQGAATNNFSYTFTANAGTVIPASRVFCSGFESGEVTGCVN